MLSTKSELSYVMIFNVSCNINDDHFLVGLPYFVIVQLEQKQFISFTYLMLNLN